MDFMIDLLMTDNKNIHLKKIEGSLHVWWYDFISECPFYMN